MKAIGMGLLSALWSTASWLTSVAQRLGWIQARDLGARVVSVGNIQAGGAGKTPLVAQIAREGIARGLRVCILTRGYRGAWERSGGLILPKEKTPPVTACGDEVALLHHLVPEAAIGVGADRVAQYEKLVARLGGRSFDLVVLDDGFQNRKIRKTLEVVALTSVARTRLPFRDWGGALKRADLLVWTKGNRRPAVPRGKPLVRVRYHLAPPPERREVFLVAGVAEPGTVVERVRLSGYEVSDHAFFPDHARYDQSEVRRLLERARSRGLQLALTGKDWVKWKELGVAPSEVWVLEPELRFEEGRSLWDQILWGESSSSS